MTYTRCEKCGKELDSESIIFQKFVSWMYVGPSAAPTTSEWKEVSWQRGRAEQVKTEWGKDGLKKEIALCSSCTEQFRKKIQRDEWRSGIFLAGLVVLAVFEMLILWLYAIFSSK